MAFSVVTKGLPVVPGSTVQQVVQFTGDASYPNPAGYVLTAATFGLTILKKIPEVIPATVAAGKWEIVLIPTYATDGQSLTSVALHLVVSTTGVEIANAVDVSTFVATIIGEGN